MDVKVKGAWIIHHTNKLQGVNEQPQYSEILMAGKSGKLLSAICADNHGLSLDKAKLEALASHAGINKYELPIVTGILKNQGVVDTSTNGIAVLGVTGSSVLSHTAKVFDSLNPCSTQKSTLDFAEIASGRPQKSSEIKEKLSDNFKLSSQQIENVFDDCEKIGFIDCESLNRNEKLYFNGNIFRRDSTIKINAVLNSLTEQENRSVRELNAQIKMFGCLDVITSQKMLGIPLYNKLTSIGLYDINVVSNPKENAGFLTLPSAFSKYGNSLVEDAFDLAKAFVSSITYGMTKSSYERGQITMVSLLLQTLIRGNAIGPVNAIAQDYKILELKGVVEVFKGTKNGRTGYMMKLKKPEIGELALQVLIHGSASEHSLSILPSAPLTSYTAPEINRVNIRKNIGVSSHVTSDILNVLRTGATHG